MSRDNRLACQAGFTLVEMMVVVVILVICAALAAPAFSRMIEATRIRAEATRLMSDVVLARSEAIKRNRSVVMCPAGPSQVGTSGCSGLYRDGWMLFEDDNGDGEPDPTEEVLRVRAAMAPRMVVTNRAASSNSRGTVRMYPDGSSRRNLTLMVCSTAHPELVSWSLVLNLVGRPRLARDWGECPVN